MGERASEERLRKARKRTVLGTKKANEVEEENKTQNDDDEKAAREGRSGVRRQRK